MPILFFLLLFFAIVLIMNAFALKANLRKRKELIDRCTMCVPAVCVEHETTKYGYKRRYSECLRYTIHSETYEILVRNFKNKRTPIGQVHSIWINPKDPTNEYVFYTEGADAYIAEWYQFIITNLGIVGATMLIIFTL